jgi:hypothetical protein
MPEDREDRLATEMKTFEELRPSLEQNHMGKFVVIRDGALVGVWDTLDAAAREAVIRFGRGPYLIRQVGAPPPVMPASVMFRELANV